tara:strand:- start:30 stop:215 length:186 start_codon:yes stop_codon:yes gene_type:complete
MDERGIFKLYKKKVVIHITNGEIIIFKYLYGLKNLLNGWISLIFAIRRGEILFFSFFINIF